MTRHYTTQNLINWLKSATWTLLGFLLNLRSILKVPTWPGDDAGTEATLVKRSPPPPNRSWPLYSSILEQQPCVTRTFSQSFHDDQRRPWHIRGAQLMWRGAIELFVHQRNPSPKINIIQNPRRFEEKNICVGFNRILTCILFFSLCIRSFSSHHQVGCVGRTYFFKDCTRLYSSKNRTLFFPPKVLNTQCSKISLQWCKKKFLEIRYFRLASSQ